MTKAELRAECTALADEADEARAEATALFDRLEWITAYSQSQEAFSRDLADDVRALIKENEALRRVVKTLAKLA